MSRRSLARRRDAGVFSRAFLARFPRMLRARTVVAVDRWLENGWTELCGGGADRKTGAETPDAGRRAPAVLDSGQRPRCLSGEMAEKGNRARGWGCLPITYFRGTSDKYVPLWRKKGPLCNGTMRTKEKGALAAKCWRGERDGVPIPGEKAISM